MTDYRLGHLIHILNRYKDKLVNSHSSIQNVTAVQFKILLCLSFNQSMTPSEMSTDIGVDSAAITRTLDRLEKKELIQRVRSISDRRQIHIILSPKGELFAQQIPTIVSEITKTLTKGLTPAEAELFQQLLVKILTDAAQLPK